MKKLSQCMTPWSWIFVAALSWGSLIFLLRPTLLDFIIFFVADSVAFKLTSNFEAKLAYRLHPFTKYFLTQGLEIPPEVKMLPKDSLKQLIEQIMSYPLQRAYYTFLVSWIKAAMVLPIMLYFWHFDGPFYVKVGYMLISCFFSFVFFSGIIFIESHFYLSKLLKVYHEQLDIRDILISLSFRKTSADFLTVEKIFLGAILTTGFFLESFVIVAQQFSSNLDLLLKTTVITFITYAIFWRFRHLTQKFLIGGLTNLFTYMDRVDQKQFDFSVPIHSSELLAKFEQSFNIMLDKIKRGDEEIAQWVMIEADKSRYRALGEMSALVAHDLSSPLSVIKFCADQMTENPNVAIEKPEYLTKLKENSDRAIELTEALRARLKNKANEVGAFFSEAHGSVVKILETQFFSDGFGKIRFETSEDTDLRKLKMNRVDLVQVLDNIYRNAALNLLKFKAPHPLIRVTSELSQKNGKSVVRYVISDNGTGLSQEQFHDMTSFRFRPDGTRYPGLGLKLTRRLIELNGGQLTLLETPELDRGTSFALELPCE